MAELSPGLQSALSQARVLLFGAVSIGLPGHELNLLDGAGTLKIGDKTFVGRDGVYGVLDTIKGLNDQIGNQAPTVTLGLIPSSDAALSALVSAAAQGSPVTVMVGVANMATGVVVPDPYALFLGELDVPTITWDNRDRRVEFSVISVADRFFQIEEGRRLSDSFHQKVWPGEAGLSMATGIEYNLPWAQKDTNGIVYTRSNLPGYAETYSRS